MIDIHAHILPELDDGADHILTSLRMAEQAARSGVTDMIATPHCNQRGRFENYVSPALQDRFLEVRNLLREERIGLNLHLGMEVLATEDAPELYRDGALLTLAGSRYLLVEFRFSESVRKMTRILRAFQDAGVVPILAHPERYHAVQAQPEALYDWVTGGVHLQINKGSLSGAFGAEARQTAVRMMKHDLASFVASDAHRADWRTPVLSETYHWISSNVSERRAYRLLRENPKRVLQNLPLQPCRPVSFRRQKTDDPQVK